jgi:hypothetical protein
MFALAMLPTRVAIPVCVIWTEIPKSTFVGAFFGAELLLGKNADCPSPMLGKRRAAVLTNLLPNSASPLRIFITPPMRHAPLASAGI